MWQFGLKNPTALSLLHFFMSRMDRGTNGILMSSLAVSEVTGVAQRTVKASTKALAEARFIQVLKSGKSNVYVINNQVAWQGNRGSRYAAFGSEIILTEKEQITPVDQLIEDAKALINVPITEFGERYLVGNEPIDPPDQQEMELP
jgi:hypothetical protein